MGSTFTLYLPEIYPERFDSSQIYAQRHQEASAAQEEMLFPEDIMDDRSESLGENHIVFPASANEVIQVQGLAQEADLLRGKKILIVDDDIRNIFALSSVFEGYQMQVAFAENGQQALDIVEAQADFDLILMDIMMPEMDGYDTIKLLRSNPQFAKLPIIAITAKAMDEDREQCLEAGASDYLSKPIHIEQLLSLMYNNLVDGENADGI
jgi:CheY-like chemotaxis protein